MIPVTVERARRDLLWLLEHAPVLQEGADANSCWIGAESIRACEQFQAGRIASIPDAVLAPALAQRRSGRYFEALLVALIESDETFELIAHDLQVRDAKKTLGAFDLLFRNRISGTSTHLELAFKQYLHKCGDGSKAEHWVGPRAKDRLDIKSEHMLTRQLKLSESEAGMAALRAFNVQAVEARALMAGRLFIGLEHYAKGQVPRFPAGCSEPAELGWWCTQNEIEQLEMRSSHWRLLPPVYAVAPLDAQDCEALPAPTWLEVRHQLERGVPCPIAEIDQTAELSRGWIVCA